MELQVRPLVLLFLFTVMDGVEWLWMASLHKNIQVPILGPTLFLLYINDYTLMTFLMMLFVMSLSILMILLSILSVVEHLICGNNLNWLLKLNLIYETLWTGARSGLLISMMGKSNWCHLTSLITLALLIWKCMGLFLRKNHLLRCWG